MFEVDVKNVTEERRGGGGGGDQLGFGVLIIFKKTKTKKDLGLTFTLGEVNITPNIYIFFIW